MAERAGVSRNTIVRFELEQGGANRATLAVIRQAFEAAGIEFKEDGSLRLREHRQTVS